MIKTETQCGSHTVFGKRIVFYRVSEKIERDTMKIYEIRINAAIWAQYTKSSRTSTSKMTSTFYDSTSTSSTSKLTCSFYDSTSGSSTSKLTCSFYERTSTSSTSKRTSSFSELHRGTSSMSRSFLTSRSLLTTHSM